MYEYIIILIAIILEHFFDLQVANSPIKLSFEANLSREDIARVQSTVKSQR